MCDSSADITKEEQLKSLGYMVYLDVYYHKWKKNLSRKKQFPIRYIIEALGQNKRLKYNSRSSVRWMYVDELLESMMKYFTYRWQGFIRWHLPCCSDGDSVEQSPYQKSRVCFEFWFRVLVRLFIYAVNRLRYVWKGYNAYIKEKIEQEVSCSVILIPGNSDRIKNGGRQVHVVARWQDYWSDTAIAEGEHGALIWLTRCEPRKSLQGGIEVVLKDIDPKE